MSKIYIYGAGLSGLIAADILRKYDPVVCEIQSELPNNHGALLRFRSNAVSLATGIPFKKVFVQKAICSNEPYAKLFNQSNLKMNNQYSYKVSGSVQQRSILNLEDCQRWIAPPDFIERLSKGLNIEYDVEFNMSELSLRHNDKDIVISTIPMPSLMKIVYAPNNLGLNYFH